MAANGHYYTAWKPIRILPSMQGRRLSPPKCLATYLDIPVRKQSPIWVVTRARCRLTSLNNANMITTTLSQVHKFIRSVSMGPGFSPGLFSINLGQSWDRCAENKKMSEVVESPVLLITWQLPATRKDRQPQPRHTGCRKLRVSPTVASIIYSASAWRRPGDSTGTLNHRQPIAEQQCRPPGMSDAGSTAALTDEDRPACTWARRQWTRPPWWCHSKHLSKYHYHTPGGAQTQLYMSASLKQVQNSTLLAAVDPGTWIVIGDSQSPGDATCWFLGMLLLTY